jgi:hypothetical protein
LSRPIIVRTRGESHQWDGITDPKRLQLPFATKSAQSGHAGRARRCPLLGVKRTSEWLNAMSAFDPKRTLLHSGLPPTLEGDFCGASKWPKIASIEGLQRFLQATSLVTAD